MVAGSRAIVGRGEQGNVAAGCGVTGRQCGPAGTSSTTQPGLSLLKSRYFFEREENEGGGRV